jgi:hypothetical protein
MLFPIYTAVKNQLTTSDVDAKLKGIEWYNVQYEGVITNAPRVFIEFPDALKFDEISKDARRSPLRIRLHVVTQAIAGTDGAIPDTTAEEHEAIAKLVEGWIDTFIPQENGSNLTSMLRLTGWQHFHKYKGWMVTFLEFTARMTL